MAIVLVTCAGSGVGQSVLDSLNLIRKHKLIGCDSNRNVYAYHFCDSFYVVPSIYSDRYLDFLLDICIKEKVDVIIPGHDHELVILSKNISKFNDKGIQVIVSRPDLIEVSRDKYQWYNYFTKYGCPIVPTYRVIDFKKNPDNSIFPAIVKPSAGSASQGILILNSPDDINLANENDIIQPYLFPRKDDTNFETIQKFVRNGKFVQMSEISIQLIFTKESEFAGIFISKNILKSGVPVFVDPIVPKEFEYIDDIMKFVPVCVEKGVRGPVNIQGRITDKGLICFEMNMRFTGITGNRAQLGFNEVSFLVDNYLGVPGKLDGYATNKFGVRQVACTTIPREKSVKVKNPTFSILGAGGSIGSFFVKELIKSGEFSRINIICRDSSFERYKSMFTHGNIHIIKESDEMLQTAYCQSDILVNFVSALAYEPDVEKYKAIIFQHQQVHNIVKANIPLVINVSSQSVYDQILNIEKKENHDLKIENLYSFQKLIAEKFFETIESFSPSIKSISLRFPRVFGAYANQKDVNGFFGKVIESLINGDMVKISNPLNNTNLIDVRDVVGAIFHIIYKTQWKSLPNVLNVGGTNLTLKDYCLNVVECIGDNDKIKLVDFSESKDITASSMINSDLFSSYGWSQKYSVKDSIFEIVSSLKR